MIIFVLVFISSKLSHSPPPPYPLPHVLLGTTARSYFLRSACCTRFSLPRENDSASRSGYTAIPAKATRRYYNIYLCMYVFSELNIYTPSARERFCLTFWLHSDFCEGDPPVLNNIYLYMYVCIHIIYIYIYIYIYILRFCLTFWLHSDSCEGDPPVL